MTVRRSPGTSTASAAEGARGKTRSVGIILSGSGRDGASGVSSIKMAGGVTMAEDPSKAEFSAMPYAAVATGCVDLSFRSPSSPPAW
jgi:chemotaxis response regulator CheB